MPRCAGEDCGRWRPDVLVRHGAGANIDGRWFCSRECIERMARQLLVDVRPALAAIPTVPPARLGAILRQQGVCGSAEIERALEAQRHTGLRLGEQLLAMGVTEPRPLLRALAAQAGVSYLANVDAALVRKAPGGLSSDAVRALGLMPISEAVGGRIRVACPAPIPRRALEFISPGDGMGTGSAARLGPRLAKAARQLRHRFAGRTKPSTNCGVPVGRHAP